MKIKSICIMLSLVLASSASLAQSMDKKFKTVKVSMHINAPAERVWEAMVLDYGEISNFAPPIFTSEYVNGSLKGKVGAERKCNFNAKGTRWSHEQIAEMDPNERVMRNIIIDGGKLPLNFDNSQAFYTVKDNGDGTSTAAYEFQFRTKPAFLGGVAKGGFKKQLSATLVGLKHYLETGEKVNGSIGNYKEIKGKYDSPILVKPK